MMGQVSIRSVLRQRATHLSNSKTLLILIISPQRDERPLILCSTVMIVPRPGLISFVGRIRLLIDGLLVEGSFVVQ